MYKLSSSVNEKPSWVFADYAIWYNPRSERFKSGVWCIGPSNSLGTGLCWISAEFRFDFPYDQFTEWRYFGLGRWVTFENYYGINDVNVQPIKNQKGTKFCLQFRPHLVAQFVF